MTNQEIMTAIKHWQSSEKIHPLTCGNDSNHLPLLPFEENGLVVLRCFDCGYRQEHIPRVVISVK